jgi:hypothetical protein
LTFLSGGGGGEFLNSCFCYHKIIFTVNLTYNIISWLLLSLFYEQVVVVETKVAEGAACAAWQ